MALDLAYRYPEFRDALIPIIKANPNAGHESLSNQLETLLISPLKESGISTIVVIDAIDECRDDKSTSAILSVLGRHVDSLSSAKFFITGRPEPRIKSGFNLPLLRSHTDVFQLWDVEKKCVDHDIRLYIHTELSALVEGRTEIQFPVSWPDEGSLNTLVQRADGLFIFASTTCKLMSLHPGNPIRLLQQILDTYLSTNYEGEQGIDALYTQILTENHKNSHSIHDVSAQANPILGTVVLARNPLLLESLAILLNMDPNDIRSFLRSLASVIQVPSSPDVPVSVFHKSFPDYLLEESRCGDPRFHVDSGAHHGRLAINCLQLMKSQLKRNICDLPHHSTNDEVKDLEERRRTHIGEALEYACTSWAHHLSQASLSTEILAAILDLMDYFINHLFLAWLEVLSIARNLRSAVYSLRDAKGWLSQVRPSSDVTSVLT
jgi:hypothetical protein